ncbi:MAG TPA: hypothetical protein VHO72_18005 [Bacteroidales bacterium]|nr:hypothetical protein [Bacteroidales bacterium]
MKKIIFSLAVILLSGISFGQSASFLGMQMKLTRTWAVDSIKKEVNFKENTFEAMSDDDQIEFEKLDISVRFTGQYEAIVTITNKSNTSQKVEKRYTWEIKNEYYNTYNKATNSYVEEKIPTLFLVNTDKKNDERTLKIIALTKKRCVLQGKDFVLGTLQKEIVLSSK